MCGLAFMCRLLSSFWVKINLFICHRNISPGFVVSTRGHHCKRETKTCGSVALSGQQHSHQPVQWCQHSGNNKHITINPVWHRRSSVSVLNTLVMSATFCLLVSNTTREPHASHWPADNLQQHSQRGESSDWAEPSHGTVQFGLLTHQWVKRHQASLSVKDEFSVTHMHTPTALLICLRERPIRQLVTR